VGALLALGGAGAALGQNDIGIAPLLLDQDTYLFDTAEQHSIRVDVVVRGLAHPFSLAMLPDGDALVVIRGQSLLSIRNATGTKGEPEVLSAPVEGAPEPADFRGGGLHDIAVHPDFASNRLVYYTYNRPGMPDPDAEPPGRRPTAIVLARARFAEGRLSEAQDLFVGEERAGASGSRIAFGRGGYVFVTTGAPFGPEAQDPSSVYGKVLRLHDDGRVPRDNPFVGQAGARPEIYTLGHRDQLGLTTDPRTGAVLAAEHGPNGGDEVNLVLPGRNYGWPDYSFGRSYEGPRHSPVPLGEDTEQPIVLWIPSIAPTGMTFYDGDRFPAWRGNLFVGSARRGQIPGTGGLERIVFNDELEELRRESLLGELHQRIRDVRQGRDGLLYAITDEDDGVLLRISPTL
jgi:glucose/arabinose dehydrogenase